MRKKFDTSLLPPRPDLSIEMEYWNRGISKVVGVDEAGRGAWAGPVYAGAVIFPPDQSLLSTLSGINDSKKLTAEERDDCAVLIKRYAMAWGTGMASSQEIDELGILPATLLAMNRAITGLAIIPEHIIVDYISRPIFSQKQTALIKGDARSMTIAAASILAKTERDSLMVSLSKEFPGYGLERHKGYGTLFHRECLERMGATAIHRKSYHPIAILEQPTLI